MRIVVAGSHGLVGQALLPVLRDGGHDVVRLVRRPADEPDEASWDPGLGRLDPAVLVGADAVVDLAGSALGLGRERRREIVASRVRTAGLLARTVAEMDDGPSVMLQASATGAYGDRGDDLLTEDEPYGDTFLAQVVSRWEQAAQPAAQSGCRLVLLRTGIVLSPAGGALARLLPMIRMGLGAKIGSGRQFWPWITLADEVRAIEHLLRADVSGPVNLVAMATRNAELMSTLSAHLRRRTVLRVPAPPVRAVLGDLSSELLGSTRADPAALRAASFRFSHPDATAAARWVRACLRNPHYGA
ncbi:MAG: TIGR01777 family oxidoreductase [Micrococcales bacterium]|nr:TIGR01777 family oxidoreductase [Micrococcales bacterium]MCL2667896.1 TIGR01777 family oxidoreductase [Micrococcales bacterium]